MKRMTTLMLGLIAITTLAEVPKESIRKSQQQILEEYRRLPPQQRAAIIAARRAEAERRNGGYLIFESTGNVIRVENSQKLVSRADVESLCENFGRNIGAAVEVADPDTPKNPKTVVTVQLVENGNGPVLLIAPEDKYGILNVSRLKADSPDDFRLRQRFGTEFWRVMCLTLGAFQSRYSPCVMRNVFSLGDLDRDLSACVCPEVFDKVQSTCRALGITGKRRITYIRACMDGIAPPPTNDIQKAIWDKVHAMPTAPLKIKPETKKVAQ